MNSAVIKAAIPLIVAVLASIGVVVSPSLAAFLTANPQILGFVIAGLGTYFPSMVAAIKFKEDAK